MFEALDRVLPSEDPDISRLAERGFKKQGIDVLGGTPKEFADYVRSETAKWSRVVAAAGMKQ